MDSYSDSTDRNAAEFLRFALGFLGFMVAAAGIIVGSPAFAVIGAAILLLVLLSFFSGPAEEV
ncbi:MAG TPA: hypothetical protein VN578_04290 [Candidatus Binatia bacterium]|nr:hypothetical protein [Candidatus Binatia bacterium]